MLDVTVLISDAKDLDQNSFPFNLYAKYAFIMRQKAKNLIDGGGVRSALEYADNYRWRIGLRMHKKLCVGAQLLVHNNLWKKCLFRNRPASSYSTFPDRVYSGSTPRDPRDQPDKEVLPEPRQY
jgi:hypothetical protein